MYQTKEKQDSITLLHQEAKIELANVKQATLVRNMSIAGAILLLILVGLIYNRYRQKQKNNRLLQSQKEEINKNNQQLHQLNEQQTKLLVEKDWLVKEIHHRVKNNLQIVMSLLNSQTAFIDNQPALSAIHDSQHRVHAMSLIHQKLYNSENLSSIDMSVYLEEFLSYLKESFDAGQIEFMAKVEPIQLNLQQAIPVALIINEAVTNSIKYAFKETTDPKITVSMYESEGLVHLIIADNGKGLPDNMDAGHSNSLGMQLIRLFSEQLEGDLYFMNNNGLEIILNFKATGYNQAAVNKITA